MKSKHVDASLQSCDACLPPLLFLSLLQPAFTLVIVLFAMLRITHVSMLRLRLMCRLVPHLKCFRFNIVQVRRIVHAIRRQLVAVCKRCQGSDA